MEIFLISGFLLPEEVIEQQQADDGQYADATEGEPQQVGLLSLVHEVNIQVGTQYAAHAATDDAVQERVAQVKCFLIFRSDEADVRQELGVRRHLAQREDDDTDDKHPDTRGNGQDGYTQRTEEDADDHRGEGFAVFDDTRHRDLQADDDAGIDHRDVLYIEFPLWIVDEDTQETVYRPVQ